MLPKMPDNDAWTMTACDGVSAARFRMGPLDVLSTVSEDGREFLLSVTTSAAGVPSPHDMVAVRLAFGALKADEEPVRHPLVLTVPRLLRMPAVAEPDEVVEIQPEERQTARATLASVFRGMRPAAAPPPKPRGEPWEAGPPTCSCPPAMHDGREVCACTCFPRMEGGNDGMHSVHGCFSCCRPLRESLDRLASRNRPHA